MRKWMAVMALGAAMAAAAAGCENNKADDASAEPQKMSLSSGSKSECCASKKATAAAAAEPKKLSAASADKADCASKCPTGATKAK